MPDPEQRMLVIVDELVRALAPALAAVADRHGVTREEMAAAIRAAPMGTTRMPEAAGIMLHLLAEGVQAEPVHRRH